MKYPQHFIPEIEILNILSKYFENKSNRSTPISLLPYEGCKDIPHKLNL